MRVTAILGMVLGLTALALASWAHGLGAAAAVFAAWWAGWLAMHGAFQHALFQAGYRVELRPDMTGRKRWRVGTVERAAVAEPERVRWIAPGQEAGDG